MKDIESRRVHLGISERVLRFQKMLINVQTGRITEEVFYNKIDSPYGQQIGIDRRFKSLGDKTPLMRLRELHDRGYTQPPTDLIFAMLRTRDDYPLLSHYESKLGDIINKQARIIGAIDFYSHPNGEDSKPYGRFTIDGEIINFHKSKTGFDLATSLFDRLSTGLSKKNAEKIIYISSGKKRDVATVKASINDTFLIGFAEVLPVKYRRIHMLGYIDGEKDRIGYDMDNVLVLLDRIKMFTPDHKAHIAADKILREERHAHQHHRKKNVLST